MIYNTNQTMQIFNNIKIKDKQPIQVGHRNIEYVDLEYY